MESSCFICGVNTIKRTNRKRKRVDIDNDNNLNQLMTRLYKILTLKNVNDNSDGWDDLTSSQQESICCGKCYNLLKNVERVHEIILETEKQLKTYLDEISTLVMKSDKLQSIYTSLWSPNCFELRWSILEKATSTNDHVEIENDLLSKIRVKQEDGDSDDADFDCHSDFAVLDHLEDTFDHDSCNKIISQNDHAIGNPDVANNENCGREKYDHVRRVTISNNIELPNDLKSAASPVKRRKFKIICDEDEEKVTWKLENLDSRNSFTTRRAKRKAEVALQQYVSDSNDIFGGNQEDEEIPPSAFEVNESSDDNDNTISKNSVKSIKKRNGTRNSSGVKRLNKPEGVGEPRKKDSGKALIYQPFLIAEENLYLYRFHIFVRKTNTHLICQASNNCSFETKWEYYSSFQVIRNHIESEHRAQSYGNLSQHCFVCNTTHKDRPVLNKHLRENHDYLFTQLTPAICECCLMDTPKFHLETHMLSHKNEEEKAEARAIEENIATRRRLRIAKAKEGEAKGDGTFVCPYENCGTVFKYYTSFKRHKQTHLPPEQRTDKVDCPECGRRVLKECLSNHMRKIHRPDLVDKEKLLICPVCDKKFLSKENSMYQAHVRRHNGEKPSIECQLCDMIFYNKGALNEHVRYKHTKHDPVPCEFCDKICSNKKTLRIHKSRRHRDKVPRLILPSKFHGKEPVEVEDLGEYKYVCKFEGCNRAFKYEKSHRRHKQTHLSIEERTDQTVCPECGIRILKESLKQHMWRVHHPEMVEKVLVCEFCDKRFLTSDNAKFQGHLRRHKGEKPFLCTQCGLAFVSNTSLKGHIKQVHGDNEEISCEWCDNVYTKEGSLKRHITAHHPDEWAKKKRTLPLSKFYDNTVIGEVYGPIQKFPCPICDTLFAYNESLKRHMRRKHNIGKEPSTRKKVNKRRTKGSCNRRTTKSSSSESESDEKVEDLKPSSEFGLHGYGFYQHFN